jgi:ATP-dependent RNA helicase RhlE
MLNFQKLNLNPLILKALEKKGYNSPTPIQSQSIPHLLNGSDILGIAQTGTGKTAAFSLPLLDKLSKKTKSKSTKISALILSPTRELAVQIADNIKIYGEGLHLKHALIFGGVNEFHQIKALKTGVDIVIATPGRLLDLTNQGFVDYSAIEYFVLDEADRMLDMGFINDVRKIIAKLPKDRQSLLFSATMPDSISQLAHSILKDPIKVEITPQSTTVEKINQKIFQVGKSNKSALLLDIINGKDVIATLVFCRTKHGANKVVEYLKKYGVLVSAIHGNKSQPAREKALNDLRSGAVKVLIATDIAARGIDVPSISHVINYDIPHDPESYVHRIGRTARAGREGMAISLCDFSENSHLRAIEKIIGMKIPVDKNHPFHGVVESSSANEGRILSRAINQKRDDNKATDSRFNKSRKVSSTKLNDNNYGRKSSSSKFNNSRGFLKKSADNFKIFSKNEADNFHDKRKSAKNHDEQSEKKESTAKKILKKFGFDKFSNFKKSDNFGNSDKYVPRGKTKFSSKSDKLGHRMGQSNDKNDERLITKGENFNYRHKKKPFANKGSSFNSFGRNFKKR